MKPYTLLRAIFLGPSAEHYRYIDDTAHAIVGDLIAHGPSTSVEIFARVNPVQEVLGQLALVRSEIYGVLHVNGTHPDRPNELIFYVDRKGAADKLQVPIQGAGKNWGEV